MDKKNIETKNVELLAPAGSYDSFVTAINAGADAVYMGLKNFNARVMTNNFNIQEYMDAIDYAHKRNVKVYLTLNTLLLDSECSEALKLVYKLYEVGLDGVIVQDLGVASLIHKVMPDLSLHASTQMSICTLEQVKVLERLGFSRVVLARELSIEEIKHIAKNTPLEIEVFVHGALCVSVSGQCLMSAMIGDRSANRGTCAGPCRKRYSLYSNEKLIQKNKYLLSKKDIFGLDKLQDLMVAGVDSLKIEGRNKTPEYVAGVIRNYRQAVDKGYDESQDYEVLQLFNRSGKCDGYLTGTKYRTSISEFSPKNTGLMLGKIIDVKNKYIKVKLKEDIDIHDGIESLGENNFSTIVTCIRDDKFNLLNCTVKKGQTVWLGDVKHANIGEDIYKTSSNKLNEELNKYSKLNLKRLQYDITVCIKENEKISVKVNDEVKITLDYIPQQSKTSSVNDAKVKEAFSKTEETSVKFNVNTDIQEGLFVPTSKLNELRKLTVEKLEQQNIIRNNVQDIDKRVTEVLQLETRERKNESVERKDSLYVYKYNKDVDYINWYENKYGRKLDILYITATDFNMFEQDILKYVSRCKVYFAVPNVTLKNLTKYIFNNLHTLCEKGVSGVLLGNLGYIDLCNELKKKYNIEIVADYSLNIMNSYCANALKKLGVDRVTPLFENEDIDLDRIDKIVPIEIVQDLATVMTTRYCVIASFAKDSNGKKECMCECMKNNYYLIDEQNKRYDILTDNLDCISKYVRNKKQYEIEYEKRFSTRHNTF